MAQWTVDNRPMLLTSLSLPPASNPQILRVVLKQKLCGLWQVPKETWEGSGPLAPPRHLPQPSQCFLRPPCTPSLISSLAVMAAGLSGSTYGMLRARHSSFPWTVVILFKSHKIPWGMYCYYPIVQIEKPWHRKAE